MLDVITIGSATQDVYLFSKHFRSVRDSRSPNGRAESFALGTKTEVEKLLVEVGGGATNAAATFVHQGLRTACACKVGADAAGDEVVRVLHKLKIGTQYIVRDHDDHTALSTIFLGKDGERTVLVYRGASADFTERMLPWRQLRSRWFYITSLGGNLRFLRHALAHAKRIGAQVAVNPGKAELAQRPTLLRLVRNASVLLLNAEEAQLLFRAKGRRLQQVVAKWRKGIVVVTEGERGAWAVTPQGAWQLRVKPVRAVDTTGAGDAFGSAFVSALAKRPQDIPAALRLGAINGASVVQVIGAKHGLIDHRIPRGPWMKVTKILV